MDPDIKLYLKPRPVHSKFGNHPWMLLDFGFPYGPFCSWQTIPPDATEIHTVHSPALAAALTTLHVEILPKLRKFRTDIARIRSAATTSAFSVVSWEGFDAIEQAQGFFAYCQYQPVKLMLGDKAPPSPTRYRMSSKDSPEFWKILDDVLFPVGRDIELADLDTDFQRLLWTSILLVLAENLTPLLELQNYIRSCLRQNPVGYVLGCIEKYVLPPLDRWIGGGEAFGDRSKLASCSTTTLLGNGKVKID